MSVETLKINRYFCSKCRFGSSRGLITMQ